MSSFRQITIVLAGVILLLAIPTFVFFNRNALSSFAESVQPRHERFTELYLENHTLLPKTITKDGVYTFSFTIHNLEYARTTYPYIVFAEAGEVRHVLDKGTVTLDHDKSKTITESFSIVQDIPRARIIISLPEKDQSIHFWMGN